MQRYPWLDFIYHKILHSYQNKNGHHALLFYGTEDNGEDILITSIVRWLICSHAVATGKVCNICYNCQLLTAGNHPDYYLFDVSSSNTEFLGIDHIRSFIYAIQHCSHQNKNKIVLIKFVENLTNYAINALLKIIEEPPSNTYFFLYTKKYMQIPTTLLSRCIKWHVFPPKEKIGLQWLMQEQKLDDVLLARCVLRLCNGSPIEAKNILVSGLWEKRLLLCKSVYYALINKNFLKILPFLNTSPYNIFLYWFITVILDALKWKIKMKKRFLINADQLQLINIIAINYDMVSLNKQLQQWLTLFRFFQKFTNINYELLLTYRLLNWQRNIVESCFYSWSI